MRNNPVKGQPFTSEELLSIAIEHKKQDIVNVLSSNPPKGEFVSDGCSMWPDSWRGKDIFLACFWHDARYWMGIPGDEVARLCADADLAKDVAVSAGPDLARVMFVGVGFGGTDKIRSPFRWGYGR